MNTFRYIVIVLAICSVFISCEREEESRLPVQNVGRPISFTTESIWPDMTKAPINNLGDLLNDGLRVWGAWANDPDDKSYFVGDYATGTNGSVFGTAGTVVNAVDVDGNGNFDPNSTTDSWEYANIKDWYRGYYSFAAILPNSLFTDHIISSASLSSAFAKTGDDDNVTIMYDNTLTINFLDAEYGLLADDYRTINGIDISEEVPAEQQQDLMFAFQNEDNSDEMSENVSLNFVHAFARLGVRLTANNPDNIPYVTRVTIYGIHKSAKTLNYTQETIIENYRTTESKRTTATTCQTEGTISTADDYYAVFEMPEGHFENDKSPEDMVLLENLPVFPEDLSVTPLSIKLEYKKVRVGDNRAIQFLGDGEYTMKVGNGKWEPGNSYVFAFGVDDIDLNGFNETK